MTTWLKCNQCGHVFKRRNSRQYKCERCGAHFTFGVKEPRKGCQCSGCRWKREKEATRG